MSHISCVFPSVLLAVAYLLQTNKIKKEILGFKSLKEV